ncbi:MAG: hypothetical protein ACE5G1_17510, partial [bacterium]
EEKAPKVKDTVKLDVETILQTTEGRVFLDQLKSVSRVLSFKDSEVEFKGEEILKTGYVGDCKRVHLFKCPNGYFLFCNKAFTKNNWSTTGEKLNELVSRVENKEIRERVSEMLATTA